MNILDDMGGVNDQEIYILEWTNSLTPLEQTLSLKLLHNFDTAFVL